MKILHINSYFSVSNFYKNFFDTQKSQGIDFDVFIPVSKNYNNKNFDFGEYGILSKNHNKYDRLIFHIKHKKIIKDLEEKLDIMQYSLTHAHSLFSNGFIAYKLKEKYNIPYVVAVRNTDVNVFFKKMFHLRKLGIKILKEADKVIFLSSSYQEKVLSEYVPTYLQKEILEKAIIIPNGMDNFWFKNLNLPKTLNQSNQLKLLYVGNVDKNKNILTSIESIKILRRKGFNITYTVVGKIVHTSIYKKINKNSFVQYIEPIAKEKLIEIYRENDIFIMPSINETFGLVYIEAMSQGVPVIYSKGQGFDRQFKNGEIGYAVNSKNPKQISNTIIQILSNYEYLSMNSINRVDRFNWRKISEVYSALYGEILNKQ